LLGLQQNFREWLTSEEPDIAARFGERARPGLGVYLNNYRAQLLACLSASYPILRAWIGDAAFEGAAAGHIESVPPRAWTLDAYGVDFDAMLESLYPADPEVPELARLERDLAAAFVGPDAAAVVPADLADVDWDAAIVCFVPTFALLTVTTNVAAIWSAISHGETPPPAARLPEPTSLVIWRHGFAPRFRTVAAEEAQALRRTREGESFAALCAALGPETAGSFLGQWLSEGLIAYIRCPGSRK
jgi:hypothetical protein